MPTPRPASPRHPSRNVRGDCRHKASTKSYMGKALQCCAARRLTPLWGLVVRSTNSGNEQMKPQQMKQKSQLAHQSQVAKRHSSETFEQRGGSTENHTIPTYHHPRNKSCRHEPLSRYPSNKKPSRQEFVRPPPGFWLLRG